MPPSASLAKTSSQKTNIIMITVFGVLGATIVLIVLIKLIMVVIGCIVNPRRHTETNHVSMPRQSRAGTDVTATSLLRTSAKFLGPEDEPFTPPPKHTSISSDKENRSRVDSTSTMPPPQYEAISIEPKEAVPSVHSTQVPAFGIEPLSPLTPPATLPPKEPRAVLAPISIPARSPYSPLRQVQSPSSPQSADSGDSDESIYSQPSRSTTPNIHRPLSLPVTLPPMEPQYSHIRIELEDAPQRADTRVIGKMLKERAKKNKKRIDRKVSRIERMGSIKSLAEDSDDEEKPAESSQGPHRLRKYRHTAPAAARGKERSNLTLDS
ncbi:hypothetical protein H0H93_007403 [Arthromyces matolae]|nr:hypothetical protein H0H93_007403 [Arthromyces matolae]